MTNNTPTTKSIRVVDEQGTDCGATYPKRAKGLVKKGRARFIDDNTLCLACPSNKADPIKGHMQTIVDKSAQSSTSVYTQSPIWLQSSTSNPFLCLPNKSNYLEDNMNKNDNAENTAIDKEIEADLNNLSNDLNEVFAEMSSLGDLDILSGSEIEQAMTEAKEVIKLAENIRSQVSQVKKISDREEREQASHAREMAAQARAVAAQARAVAAQARGQAAQARGQVYNATTKTISLSDILVRIDKILEESHHIQEACETISDIPNHGPGNPGSPGDIAGQAKAHAIGDMVKCHETTNQQALRLLEKMYDDLKNQNAQPSAEPINNTLMQPLADFVKSINLDNIPKEAQEAIKNSFAMLSKTPQKTDN